MDTYTWTSQLRAHYDKALSLYKGGNHDLSTYFTAEEQTSLASIGLKPIIVFDYVEDVTRSGEPDWETFLLVASARRDYFLYVLNGQLSSKEIQDSELPPKPEELEGIPWLPRIIVKAQSFLEGGLCQQIMYGCGGDRRFMKEHSMHLADFLREVWAARGDEQKVLAFVKRAGKK